MLSQAEMPRMTSQLVRQYRTQCCIFRTVLLRRLNDLGVGSVMPKSHLNALSVRHALQLKLGRAFEARATGWGIVAIPVVLALILGFAALRLGF